jgi:hypothetical protein
VRSTNLAQLRALQIGDEFTGQTSYYKLLKEEFMKLVNIKNENILIFITRNCHVLPFLAVVSFRASFMCVSTIIREVTKDGLRTPSSRSA